MAKSPETMIEGIDTQVIGWLKAAYDNVASACAVALIAVGLAASADAQRPGLRDRLKGDAAEAGETVSIGGRERRFIVHDFSKGKAAPMVILLHGGGGNAQNAIKMTQFDVVAKREGVIAVYPEGTSAGGPLLTWDATHCCAFASENKIDDVGFITAIIDREVAASVVDPKRVYVTGMSNGGMMSHVLGRVLSDKVAAIAPVVGAVWGDEPAPKAPVPAFIIIGGTDATVPGAGGALQLRGILGNRSAADLPVMPAMAAADYWAKWNGCGAPTTSETATVKTTRWTGCKADVVYNVVANNGHAWPGGQPGREGGAQPTAAWNASEEMWAFFRAHPKP